MKKLLLFFFIISLLYSCGTDDTGSFVDNNVVSNGNLNTLEELVLLFNIKTSDDKFLVTPTIDSVNVYINNIHWSITNSETVDISKIDKTLEGNMYVSPKKLSYLVLSRQNVIEEPDINTAGEVADYLNSLYELRAGEYACFIESFQLQFEDGTRQTYYPYVYKTFRLDESMVSIAVDEFEIEIN